MSEALTLYPALAGVTPDLASLGAAAQAFTVPAGAVVFSEHQACNGFPMVLDGEIRVSRASPDGRSLELYRVVPGELCIRILNGAALRAHSQPPV